MREMLEMILAEARGMWRFRWWALALAWLLSVAGAIYVYSLPDVYRAEARVSVDTQSILAPLLEGIAVQPNVDQRVDMLIGTLLSRSNLESIAREADLMLRADTPAEKEAIIEGLGQSIRISGSSREDIYTIRYSDPSPRQAKAVVQTTLDILMEETLGSTRQDSSTARSFLQEQVERYEGRLQEKEQQLAQFKRENSGLLPSQEGGYYSRLRQAEQSLANMQEQLNVAQSRRETLQSEIQTMEQGGSSASIRSPRVRQLDQQIQNHQQQLNDLLLRYTESHPDVIALRDRIERLQAQREQAMQSGGEVSVSGDLSTNPVYQELKISLNETSSEIASLRPKMERQRQRIEELKSKVDQITEVEARLSDLTRNYDVTKQKYQELLSRLNKAELSTDAGRSGNQVNFRVLNPPQLPLDPVGPNRMLYLAVAFAFAFGVSGGLALFLSKSKPVFMDVRSLTEATGRPVLGIVSLVRTQAQKKAATGAVAGFAAAAAVLVLVAGLGVLFADAGSQLVRGLLGGLSL